jgi:hypothetical protein
MQPTPGSRTFVLNPLLPSTSTPDAVLHLICCTCLALTFASCTREKVHLFFLAQERICLCFVQDELSLFVIVLNFHAVWKLFMLCYKWAEWTNTALHHSSKGWIVWLDRKHFFMGSFSLSSCNGQLSC